MTAALSIPPCSPAAERDAHARLAEVVRRVELAISHGAFVAGVTLPPGFALERAKNIAAELVDVLEDAFDAGWAAGNQEASRG